MIAAIASLGSLLRSAMACNLPASLAPRRRDWSRGFTLTEVLVVIAIIGTLAAIAFPNLMKAFEKGQRGGAVGDMKALENEITIFELTAGRLPDSLDELDTKIRFDPWGNPYQYLRIRGVEKMPKGKWRKDRFLVPINTDYDLYSMGPDGKSRAPLTAKHSRDDVIRAADGAYFGVAEEY